MPTPYNTQKQSEAIAKFLLGKKNILNITGIAKETQVQRKCIEFVLNYYNPNFKGNSLYKRESLSPQFIQRLLPVLESIGFTLPVHALDLVKFRKVFCKIVGIDELNIQKRTRKKEIKEERQIGMYFCVIFTTRQEITLQSIGNLFGGFDHATVLHAHKTVCNLIQTDKQFKEKVEHYKSELLKYII